MNEQKCRNDALKLSLLCMIVYAISYIGRKSFDSNLNEIIAYYGVNKGTAGIVGTCFFISYGIGQVVHGLLCRRYNSKLAIFIALVLAAVCNVSMGLIPKNGFAFLKFIWIVNGFSQATLWSSMILLINRSLAKRFIPMSIFIMCFPVSTGTFLCYGLSALYSFMKQFKLAFFTAGILMAVSAVFWILLEGNLEKRCLEVRKLDSGEAQEYLTNEKESNMKSFVVLFVLMAVFAIANNFVRDGVNSWTPTILKEEYGLENWISVLLTIAIPLVSIIGGIMSLKVNKLLKDYIISIGLFYFISAIAMLILLLFFSAKIWAITLVCFIISCCMMTGVNSIITNIFPLECGKNVNAGLVAGLIDGFCYVGSAISVFGLGSVADNIGWVSALRLLLYVCIGATALCLVKFIISLVGKKKNKGSFKNQ